MNPVEGRVAVLFTTFTIVRIARVTWRLSYDPLKLETHKAAAKSIDYNRLEFDNNTP